MNEADKKLATELKRSLRPCGLTVGGIVAEGFDDYVDVLGKWTRP